MSIQERNAPDRVSGHVATGILVDGDLVLVPAPPKALLDRGRELEVMIFPTEADGHSRIDVMDSWKWSTFTVDRHRGRPTAVTGKLAHHSTYAAQIGAVDSGELASRLDELDGDLWEALRALGAIPPGIGDIDPDLLARVGEIEREQRQPRRADHEFESYEQMTGGWCIFFCFCHPHQPG